MSKEEWIVLIAGIVMIVAAFAMFATKPVEYCTCDICNQACCDVGEEK
jgi:hypothetical protein